VNSPEPEKTPTSDFTPDEWRRFKTLAVTIRSAAQFNAIVDSTRRPDLKNEIRRAIFPHLSRSVKLELRSIARAKRRAERHAAGQVH
jgi:hypothetical protein